ncbi:S8 family serine peptidase [Saccharopolyspora sp. NPDC002376]
MCGLSAIPGLADLRKQTIGDERIQVAVLDGPVDLSHPAFADTEIRQEAPFGSEDGAGSASEAHGTAVASVIFGGQHSAVPGIAPRCRGLTVPVFSAGQRTTSQLELARAVELAVEAGAQLRSRPRVERPRSRVGSSNPDTWSMCRRNRIRASAAGRSPRERSIPARSNRTTGTPTRRCSRMPPSSMPRSAERRNPSSSPPTPTTRNRCSRTWSTDRMRPRR